MFACGVPEVYCVGGGGDSDYVVGVAAVLVYEVVAGS